MTITEQITASMAKAFFASAWADVQDEKDAVNLSGKEIMDVMPDTVDPAALHAAQTLMMDMERVNGRPINVLFAHAIVVGDDAGWLAQAHRDLTPENFGHYCAMQAMGHGVGLADAFGGAVHRAIIVPYVEFGSHSLQNDY